MRRSNKSQKRPEDRNIRTVITRAIKGVEYIKEVMNTEKGKRLYIKVMESMKEDDIPVIKAMDTEEEMMLLLFYRLFSAQVLVVESCRK